MSFGFANHASRKRKLMRSLKSRRRYPPPIRGGAGKRRSTLPSMNKAERVAKAQDILHTKASIHKWVATQEIRKADFATTIEVVKANEPDNQIFGWASVAFTADGQVEDKEGHSIDIADLEKAAYNFAFTDKAANDMHRSEPFGRMIESMMFTPEKLAALGFPTDKTGWWVGMELPPDRFQSVISGSRPMLSIEGSAILEPA